MGLRRDAIAGTAAMITEIERIATDAASDGDLVATVGDVTPSEGAINKVCGEVSFPIDIRSNDRAYRDEVESRILDRIRTLAEDRYLVIEIDLVDESDPVELNEDIIELFVNEATSLDHDYRYLPSGGGGHDAMNLHHAGIPTGMLFVPSIDGISHSPREDTPTEAIRDATAILACALLEGPPEAVD